MGRNLKWLTTHSRSVVLGQKSSTGVSKATNVHYLTAKLHNRPSNPIPLRRDQSEDKGSFGYQASWFYVIGIFGTTILHFWQNMHQLENASQQENHAQNVRGSLVTNLDSSAVFETRVLAPSMDRSLCSPDVVDFFFRRPLFFWSCSSAHSATHPFRRTCALRILEGTCLD